MARTPVPAAAATDTPVNEAPLNDAPLNEGADTTTDTDPQDEAPVAEPGTIPARVLVDHLGYQSNTLAMLTEAEAADCAGWADTDPAAVAYVASLG